MKIILVIVVILVVVIIGYLFVFPGHYNGKEHLVSFSNVKLSKPILSNSGVIIEGHLLIIDRMVGNIQQHLAGDKTILKVYMRPAYEGGPNRFTIDVAIPTVNHEIYFNDTKIRPNEEH